MSLLARRGCWHRWEGIRPWFARTISTTVSQTAIMDGEGSWCTWEPRDARTRTTRGGGPYGRDSGLKPYPTDYDSEGKLLVDGAKMANDTFKGVGWCVAFLVGWILERRFVGFSTEVPLVTRMTRLAVGLLGYYVISLILTPLMKGWILGAAGAFVTCFLQMIYIAFLFPWCVKRFEKVRNAKASDALPQA